MTIFVSNFKFMIMEFMPTSAFCAQNYDYKIYNIGRPLNCSNQKDLLHLVFFLLLFLFLIVFSALIVATDKKVEVVFRKEEDLNLHSGRAKCKSDQSACCGRAVSAKRNFITFSVQHNIPVTPWYGGEVSDKRNFITFFCIT